MPTIGDLVQRLTRGLSIPEQSALELGARITPIILLDDLSKTPELKSLIQYRFVQGFVVGPNAGNRSACQILNPDDSGVIVDLDSVYFASSVSSTLVCDLNDNTTTAALNDNSGTVTAQIADLRIGMRGIGGAGNPRPPSYDAHTTNNSGSVIARDLYTMQDDIRNGTVYPIKASIEPGFNFLIESNADAQTIICTILGSQRPALIGV